MPTKQLVPDNPCLPQPVSEWRTPDGVAVTIRPIGPDDAEVLRDFVKALSPESRYFRFMSTLSELTPAMLARFTRIDYCRETALIAVVDDGGHERPVGVGRYFADPEVESGEFALAIADDWQRRGLGRHLLVRLVEIARARGLTTLSGRILANNRRMLALAKAFGFEIGESLDEAAVRHATLRLKHSTSGPHEAASGRASDTRYG
jgi:acetyltransferase